MFRSKGHPGGTTTAVVENVTSRAPSITYLALAGASIAASLALYLTGRREQAIFTGLWPIAFLTIGNYNKLVKLLGSSPATA